VKSDFVKGQYVCVTGRLVSMTQADLADIVQSCGGTFVRHLKRCGHIVVIGADGWPARNDGTPTRLLKRARDLQVCGYPIEFVSEEDFLDRLKFTDPAGAIRGRHTIADLVRILNISALRIRKWMHAGLIQPVESTCRLARFDFDQVANAKRLCELLEQGVSLAAIRKGIEEIGHWLPDERLPLSQVALLERSRVVLRFNGVLMEGSGQRLFDFDDRSDQSGSVMLKVTTAGGSVDALFDKALELEDAGRLEEAAYVYKQAIKLECSDPILHFNLGNIEFLRGRYTDAIVSFQEALRHDPQYVEVWNNLGNAHTELHQWDQAVDAFQHAVRLVPSYADAHFNFANVLKRLGKADEAADHLHAYRRYSPADHLVSERATFLRIARDCEA